MSQVCVCMLCYVEITPKQGCATLFDVLRLCLSMLERCMGILLDRSLYQVRRTNVGLEVVGLTFVQSDCVYGVFFTVPFSFCLLSKILHTSLCIMESSS